MLGPLYLIRTRVSITNSWAGHGPREKEARGGGVGSGAPAMEEEGNRVGARSGHRAKGGKGRRRGHDYGWEHDSVTVTYPPLLYYLFFFFFTKLLPFIPEPTNNTV